MEAKQLAFLKTPTLPARKAAVAWAHEQHLPVLAQYGTVALEVQASSDEQLAALRAAPHFAAVYGQALTDVQLAALPAEAREIAASWNQSFDAAQGSAAKAAAAPDSKIGLSWGTPQFDEPRPYSELSADFFRQTLPAKVSPSLSSDAARQGGFSKQRAQQAFAGIESRLLQRGGPTPTQVYHLSRLALTHPELEEAIEQLTPAEIETLFNKTPRDRANLGVAPAAGPAAAPEAACWRMNGEIAVGVVFVESSASGGPVFSAADRTTLRTEIQTGLNWLASQHPTGGLSWVYDYQYVKIGAANGTNSSDEAYWRNPAMQAVKYAGHSYGGDWNGVANYRNDLRTANDSALAIVIFVTPYATSWHAYASNARLTLCNRNNWGGWGINTIDTITAHEVCHLFGAADEYTGSGTPCTSCTTTHGCDNAPNGNCKACAAGGGVPCVMDQNALQMCSFTRRQIGWPAFSDWQLIDGNPATKAIVAAGPHLYQLHNNGRIWRYTGVPMSGWQLLDGNPATKAIAAADNNLYQLHNNGRIWRYTGTPMTGWQLIDQNPATVAIVAAGANLYQLHNNGRIWRYTGTPITGWQLIDQNPATKAIVAADNNLYQLHNNGKIWRYTGTPISGWQQLDGNPATVAIVAAGGALYQLHNTGKVWRYTGVPMSGWQLLDQNPATKAIVAAGSALYQLHNTGKVWRYTGPPITGWQQLDNNPATVALVAAGTALYQLHNNGRIWRYTAPLIA